MYQLKRFLSHGTMALAEAGLIALLVAGLVAGTAFAAPKGGGGTGGSSFRVDDGVYAQDTTAWRGSSTATWVRARCWQAGVLVYEQYAAYGAAWTVTLRLGPTMMWTGGAATCTGEEGFWRNGTRWRLVSSDSFSVSG